MVEITVRTTGGETVVVTIKVEGGGETATEMVVEKVVKIPREKLVEKNSVDEPPEDGSAVVKNVLPNGNLVVELRPPENCVLARKSSMVNFTKDIQQNIVRSEILGIIFYILKGNVGNYTQKDLEYLRRHCSFYFTEPNGKIEVMNCCITQFTQAVINKNMSQVNKGYAKSIKRAILFFAHSIQAEDDQDPKIVNLIIPESIEVIRQKLATHSTILAKYFLED